MIALPQRLPHVIWKNDRLVPLSEGWLAESIATSAAAAGHSQWPLALDVARAIAVYLEKDWEPPVLSVENLRAMVYRSLQGIGEAEIARASIIVPPRVSISLPELAANGSTPLEFFPLLRERLGDALEVSVGGVRLEGLRSCTKTLAAAARWRNACEGISDEIIFFCRSFLRQGVVGSVDLVIS